MLVQYVHMDNVQRYMYTSKSFQKPPTEGSNAVDCYFYYCEKPAIKELSHEFFTMLLGFKN
jgi:hypothetical protein